jgi:hypothetical protein
MRYGDTHYEVHFAIMPRRGNDADVEVVHDHDRFGLFPRDTWLRLLDEACFEASLREDRLIFVGHKRPL